MGYRVLRFYFRDLPSISEISGPRKFLANKCIHNGICLNDPTNHERVHGDKNEASVYTKAL